MSEIIKKYTQKYKTRGGAWKEKTARMYQTRYQFQFESYFDMSHIYNRREVK